MSIKIYRTTDLIPIKIGSAIFKVSPLDFGQKMELQETYSKEKGTVVQYALDKLKLLFKYSIKDVQGVKLASGGDYKVSFDENGHLDEQCIEDMCNIGCGTELSTVLWGFVKRGFGGKPVDVEGNIIEGIELMPAEGADNIKK
jgi:hypothetical protein